MSKRLLAHIALFLVALFYAANYSIAKLVLDEEYIQPLGFIFLRVLTAITCFSILHFFFVREKIAKSDIKIFVLCGIFGVFINQTFFFMGLKYTSPINASLILTTTPIFVLIASAIYLSERISWQKIVGILLGAAGAILLIAYGKTVAFTKEGILGDVLVLVNAISYGLYLVIVKSLTDRYHPLTIIKWVFVVGAIFVLPIGYSDFSEIQWSDFSTPIWLAVLYVLIFATLLTYLFNLFALRQLSPTVVSIYIYLQPLLTALIALCLQMDTLNAQKLIAGALIFSGVYMVSSKTSPKDSETDVTN